MCRRHEPREEDELAMVILGSTLPTAYKYFTLAIAIMAIDQIFVV